MKLIEQKLYERIHAEMPILCIDLVIQSGDRTLLVQRNREPQVDRYWLPGGRLFKGESVDQAITRIAREEVGLEVFHRRFLSYQELTFGEDPFGHRKGTHTVSLVFSCWTETDFMKIGCVKLDENHSSHLWFRWNDDGDAYGIPKVVQNLIRDAR